MLAPLADEERNTLLWRLFDLLLKHLVKAFEADTIPSAAILAVARRFLVDNGINATSRPDIKRGLNSLAGLAKLPFRAN
jgi:hypothetical protein